MGPVSTLIDAMGQCRALDPSQSEEARQCLLPRFATDPRGFAGELLKREWLTPFQINRLYAGRGPELLQGSYVLLERIGEGGMGQVFKARNWKLGRTVALKLIRKDLLTNTIVVARFRREIEATAQFNHPNLIRAFDADQTDDGLFIVMEYVEGIDLGRLIKEQGAIPAARACDYIRQVALGLQHAHERGLVHRDIKPPNLLRANQGEVIKVLDLGLARLQDPAQLLTSQTSPGLTQLGVIVGTVDFIAPEQARDSRTVDIRADLYSLGCTFCYLLTGRVPFPGGTPTEKLIKHSVDPLPALLEVPPPVRAIVHRLMAKEPSGRYQTPGELAASLEQLLAQPEKLQLRPGLEMPATVPMIELPQEKRGLKMPGPGLIGERPDPKPRQRRRTDPRPQAVPVAAAVPIGAATAVLEQEPPRAIPVALAVPIITSPETPRRRCRAAACLGVLIGLATLGTLLAWPVVFPASATQGETSVSKPDEPEKPVSPKPKGWDGVVREFLVVGPVGRSSIIPWQVLRNPRASEIYESTFDGTFSWKPISANENGALRLPPGLAAKPAALFAQIHIWSPSARTVRMRSGAADLLLVKVNSKDVLIKSEVHPIPQPDDFTREVPLVEGWNFVLVRLGARGTRDFEFYLSFEGEGLRPALKPDIQ